MKKLLTALLIFATTIAKSQVIAGPMLGHTELRTSSVWMYFTNNVVQAKLVYYSANNGDIACSNFVFNTNFYTTATATMVNLQPGTTYTYCVLINGATDTVATGQVTTQSLWQWRHNPPTFSILTGSCAYINEPKFDRLGKPYGNDSSIFESMAKENASMMLWLGDNWYTREVDYYSEWGLNTRPAKERAMPVFKNFLKSMPQYAIWDDHDYGNNDADKSFILKDASRDVFKKFWNNPSYGQNGQGIYTKTTQNDIDFFLLDDRWFRSNDDTKDTLNGVANTNKKMFGDVQLEWLKNALLQSNSNKNITFKIIATGSQVLNPMSPFDCFRHFSVEYNELLSFIKDNNINGVVFLTGDRHHSEIIKLERQGSYPLYDITASPLTSGSHKINGPEKNNPYRVALLENMQNYTKISFSGARKDRVMKVEFYNPQGVLQTQWQTNIKALSNSKKKEEE
jgi:alkaline phosphatase D